MNQPQPHNSQLGLSPGSMVYRGEKRSEPVRMTLFQFAPEFLHEWNQPSAELIAEINRKAGVKWLHVEGIHDTKLIRELGEIYRIHPLVLDDIVNPRQRPKVEEYQNSLFIVFKKMQPGSHTGTEQIALLLLEDTVISFRQNSCNLFEPLIQRLANATGRLRSHGADYLTYAILDLIVDHYFHVIQETGVRIEKIEDELDGHTDNRYFMRIKTCKKQVFHMRQIVLPSREVMSTLVHHPFQQIQPQNQAYFRDVYDHLHQAMDNVDIFKDLLAEQTQLYMFNLSNNMNSVMKVLTIIGTIFIPLTFISSVYGMNFRFMPELEWHYGYPIVLCLMLVIGLLLYSYFRSKNWL